MLYLDSVLSKNFRFYDAQIKWLAPGGLTINQLADALYAQWLAHADIKRRHGIPVTRQSALDSVAAYIRAVFVQPIAGYNAPMPPNLAPPRAPDPPRPKARKCCGQR